MTVSFAAGTNAATYFGEYQSTTLELLATPPAYATGVYALPNRFYSPVLTDDIGEDFYYTLLCVTGQFTLIQQLIPPAFGAATAARWGAYPCSPFLLPTVLRPGAGYLGGFGVAGTTDNIVISP